ncbi:hypothetical protein ACLB2K_060140 [Fragaria x ananassa]
MIRILFDYWLSRVVDLWGNCWKLKIVSPIFILSLSIFPRISLGVFVTWLQINYMIELCETVGPDTKSDLVSAYVRLLRDNEAEVWIAAELMLVHDRLN